MALTLTDIAVTYAQGTSFAQMALRDVGMTVERGELTLVCGATGSGKSTLLKVAAGLLAPSAGTVVLEGIPVDGPAAHTGGVGLVFQSPESQLFADTALQDVAFGPRNQGLAENEAAAIATEAIGRVGLDALAIADRSPFALSGGEARRLAIAGVLAMRPAYLLLDEPTAGLDASGQKAVLAAIARALESSGVVVVSHDLDVFLQVARRVLVLCDGGAVFDGLAEELIADPRPLETAGLDVPDVLRTLLLARGRGADVVRLTLDPSEAAELLSAARGGAA